MTDKPQSAVSATLQRVVQSLLDLFDSFRSGIVVRLAYLSLRAFGLEEATLDDVRQGAYRKRKHVDLELAEAEHLDDLVATAKECLDNADTRRSAVTDKCKTLLTMSSLLLGLVGILLPKSLAFDATWMRAVCFVAVLALLNTVTLLLVIFDIGTETNIALDQEDANFDADGFKKAMINTYLRCEVALDNRTDYLVDLFRCARFFFLLAFAVVVCLFSVRFVSSSPSDQTEQVIRQLRGDPALIQLLKGPKGDKGDLGPPGGAGANGKIGVAGPKGDPGMDATVDEGRLIDQLLSDPRLKSMVDSAAKAANP